MGKDRKPRSLGGFAPPPTVSNSRRRAADSPTAKPVAESESQVDGVTTSRTPASDPFSDAVNDVEVNAFSSTAAPNNVDPFANDPTPQGFDPFAAAKPDE